MTILIITLFVIVILLMLNTQRISNYLQNRQEQQEIDFKERTNLDLWKLIKLSPGITWLGSDQFHFSNPEFYFDDVYLYLIDYNKVVKHPIGNIIEVTRTPYSQNDRRIWKIVINEPKSQIIYKIVTNQSLTTNNFSLFLDKVKENSDSVVDSEWLVNV